jgi:hypothetical protein
MKGQRDIKIIRPHVQRSYAIYLLYSESIMAEKSLIPKEASSNFIYSFFLLYSNCALERKTLNKFAKEHNAT